jgi:hypothetical protein
MERKNRGTFKVDYKKTPDENLIALIKLTFPLEITLAKMKQEGDFIQNGDIEINGVTIGTRKQYKWERPPKISSEIHSFSFHTRCSNNSYRSSITRSVRVQKDGKVSLTKVTKLLKQFTELNKDWKVQDDIRKQKEAEEQKIREANEKKMEKLKREVKFPSKVSMEHSSWDATCDTYDIHIDEITEEQVRAISDIIRRTIK